MIYLDNAATTLVSDDVAKEICRVLQGVFGNPSSLYDLGLEASRVLEDARGVVASGLGCGPGELLFTGSGTEANNIAVLGTARARAAWGRNVVMTGYEHPSVYNTVQSLQREGFAVQVVEPGANGEVDPDRIVALVDKETALVACMAVNNETGAMLDVAAVAARVKEINRRTAVHCDAVQCLMKHPLKLDGAIDTAAVSAHKIHGPKGIGALYVRKGLHMDPVLHGGGQERGLRSGTENVAYAAGFAKAVEAMPEKTKALEYTAQLNQLLRQALQDIPGSAIHSPDKASPYILNFSVPGYKSETVLHFLEERKIYVSSGSACGRGQRSQTLMAMGLPERLVDSAIRISFCADNKQSDITSLIEALKDAQNSLMRSNIL